MKHERMLQLIWMLRPDLRRGDSTGAQPSAEFALWWDLEGHRVYPAWEDNAPIRHADLFEPLSGWASSGSFGMSRILHYVLAQRSDLVAAFDVDTEDGLWSAVAWLFTHGLREYGLTGRLDDAALAALDATPDCLVLDAAADRPPLSWLMYFVWLSSADLRKRFDLFTLDGQALFRQWFLFDGVVDLQLSSLVAPRWRAWLMAPLALAGGEQAVARAALLLWHRRSDLQHAFDLESAIGREALVAWTSRAWTIEPAMAWIDHAAAPAPGMQRGSKPRPFGVNLIGFAYGELGIGEDVRMAAAACEAAGIAFSIVNIAPGAGTRQQDRMLAQHIDASGADVAPYAVNVFCLTGYDTGRVYLERGLPLFEGRYNIGWWPWELPVWPAAWQVVFDAVDEVWAATRFTHAMYLQAIKQSDAAHTHGIPLTLMPLPVSVSRMTPVRRADLGIPAGAFMVLYVFDFNSYLARKHPHAAIAAFRQAFDTQDDSVCLVLKTMNSQPGHPAWLALLDACRDDARIVLLEHTLERGEVLGLINACDTYLSLHRSEGFGRTLAEAMLFGKPVVGTDFSGNADFLHAQTGFPVRWDKVAVGEGEYPFVGAGDHAWWAEPDVGHAAEQLRAARRAGADPAFQQRLQVYADRQFSVQRIGAGMAQRVTAIYQRCNAGKAA